MCHEAVGVGCPCTLCTRSPAPLPSAPCWAPYSYHPVLFCVGKLISHTSHITHSHGSSSHGACLTKGWVMNRHPGKATGPGPDPNPCIIIDLIYEYSTVLSLVFLSSKNKQHRQEEGEKEEGDMHSGSRDLCSNGYYE